MSDVHFITTVEELFDWLEQFNEELELEITHDAGNGTGAQLTQEGIYEHNGKLRIDIVS